MAYYDYVPNWENWNYQRQDIVGATYPWTTYPPSDVRNVQEPRASTEQNLREYRKHQSDVRNVQESKGPIEQHKTEYENHQVDVRNVEAPQASTEQSLREYRKKSRKVVPSKRKQIPLEEKMEKKRKSALLRQLNFQNRRKIRQEEEKNLANEMLLKLQEEEKLRKSAYSASTTNRQFVQMIETRFAFEEQRPLNVDNELLIQPCVIIKDKYRS